MNIPRETLDELVKLRNRVADLEAELELVRDRKGHLLEKVMQHFDVTVGQARLLLALARGGVLTRDEAVGLELFKSRDGDGRSLDSQIKHLRRRLPWVEIKSHYGLGYSLEGESLLRVRRVREGRA